MPNSQHCPEDEDFLAFEMAGWGNVSLYAHLKNPRSLIRQHLQSEYPDWNGARFKAVGSSTFLEGVGEVKDLLMMPAPGPGVSPSGEWMRSWWARAGATFDWRLRFALGVAEPAVSAAASGARAVGLMASSTFPEAVVTPVGWDQTLAWAARIAPTGTPMRALDDEHEADLCRLCLLLATFEGISRMGGPTNARAWDQPLVGLGLNANLRQYLALMPEPVVELAMGMMKLAFAQAPELFTAERIIGSPTFDRSEDLGGAEGDLILDDTLLEVKATSSSDLNSPIVRQVLGYLLADSNDTYGIRRVGWYFARSGSLWVLPVEEFLSSMGGPSDLVVARRRFEQACLDPHAAPALSSTSSSPAP